MLKFISSENAVKVCINNLSFGKVMPVRIKKQSPVAILKKKEILNAFSIVKISEDYKLELKFLFNIN